MPNPRKSACCPAAFSVVDPLQETFVHRWPRTAGRAAVGASRRPDTTASVESRFKSGRDDIWKALLTTISCVSVGVVLDCRGRRFSRLCPIAAFGERLELLALLTAAAHRAGEDPQRGGRVGVAELLHHVGRVLADPDEDRGERVPQRLRGDADRQGCRPRCPMSRFARFTAGSTTSWRKLCRERRCRWR